MVVVMTSRTRLVNLDAMEKAIQDVDLVTLAGLSGKILTGSQGEGSKEFSDDTKSSVFINTALKSAIRCPECNG